MQLIDVVEGVKLALDNMNKDYCSLSKLIYENVQASDSIIKILKKEKYLERPFAYEFYHQLRRLLDEGIVDFSGPIIQAEVDKRYQQCFEKGKIPDFIIHSPNSNRNIAIIEFKLATRVKEDIREDFKKIVEFKTNRDLRYSYGIEVLIGAKNSLESCKREINNWNTTGGEKIIIIEFNTDSWNADHSVIQFRE